MWSKAELFEALAARVSCRLEPPDMSFCQLAETPWGKSQLDALRRQGEEWLSQPTPELSYQLFAEYARSGDRSRFQRPYFDRRGRLLTFALLCRLQPDDRWKRALEDILWAICSEPFWCIPAHFLDTDEQPLPFDAWETCLDLFACETGFALAETLVLCRDLLDETVKAQVHAQIERRILTPFCRAEQIHRFESMHNNWCAVCAGAIGGTAIHLVSDRARLAEILCRCLSTMQTYLDSFGEDGVCTEGVGYWTYGFGFFTCFADLLSERTQGTCNLFSLPKVKAIALCQQHYFLSEGCTVSFADGSMAGGYRMGLSCRLQEIYPECAIPSPACADDLLRDSCYRFCLGLRDFIWYRPGARFGLPARRSVWLADAQWLISASSSLCLAAKAGNNGESHNHNDCGSFLVCREGEQLLCDFGACLYDALSFGPLRYERFVHASRSHNVAMPAECQQAPGSAYRAQEVLAECGQQDRLSMELSGCYECPSLNHYHRSICHDVPAKQILVRDALDFSSPETCTEVFVSPYPITLEDGHAVFASPHAKLELTFPDSLSAKLLTETYLAHNSGEETTAYLLHLDAEKALCHEYTFVIRGI